MQLYPGIDPPAVGAWATMTFAAGFGLYPTPNVVTGGDRRNAANITAADQANRDCINLLANRVAQLNPADGSPGNSAWTASITNWNTWIFQGAAVSFQGAAVSFQGTDVFFTGDNMYVVAGKTLTVGDSLLGAGQILVHGSSSGIEALGGADIRVDGAGGQLVAQNGAELLVDSTSKATFSNNTAGIVTDPGTNNALFGTNICKAWARVHTDGLGNVIVDDGYNIDASMNGTSSITMTFTRGMLNGHYAVVGGTHDVGSPKIVRTTPGAAGSFDVSIWDSFSSFLTLTTTVTDFSIHVFARQ